MKHLIGKEIAVRANGVNIKGKLTADNPDTIILTTEKEGVGSNDVVIVKEKISMWICSSADNTVKDASLKAAMPSAGAQTMKRVPLSILACQNKAIGCTGVRCTIKKFKSEVLKTDYELFMRPCPCRQTLCRCGVVGELHEIEPKLLVTLMKDMVMGDYPEKKETKQNGR